VSFLTAAQFMLEDISAVLFPPSCGFCDEPINHRKLLICDACRDALAAVPSPICDTCGRPFPAVADTPGVCGGCLSSPPSYCKARFGVVHQGTVRRALTAFKYHGQIHRRPALGGVLIETFHSFFTAGDLDMIVPMPIHARRLIQRGFNQAVLLGATLSRHTRIPMCRTVLRKIKDTPPQVGLTRPQRLRNVRGSFGITGRERIQDKRVLLIDDVSTTGSTISEASKTIMRSGALSVEVLVLTLRMPTMTGDNDLEKEQSDGIDDA